MALFPSFHVDADTISLTNIPFQLAVGLDAWKRAGKSQPVSISLQISHSIIGAAAGDDVSKTLDYGKLYKQLAEALSKGQYASLSDLEGEINAIDLIAASRKHPPSQAVTSITLPKALLQSSDGVTFSNYTNRSDDGSSTEEFRFEVHKLNCSCIVGVNPHERLREQQVLISIGVSHRETAEAGREVARPITVGSRNIAKFVHGYHEFIDEVCKRVKGSAYQTIEALATAIARYTIIDFGISPVTISIDKPSAIAMVEAASVRITRNQFYFQESDVWSLISS